MASLIRFVFKYWIIVTLFLLFIITFLSLSPQPSLPDVPGTDKTHHFIAYAALMFGVALRKPKHWLFIALLFICWSGGIELIQPYVNRFSEWLDLAANVGGLMCGIILANIINWVFPLTSSVNK